MKRHFAIVVPVLCCVATLAAADAAWKWAGARDKAMSMLIIGDVDIHRLESNLRQRISARPNHAHPLRIAAMFEPSTLLERIAGEVDELHRADALRLLNGRKRGHDRGRARAGGGRDRVAGLITG